MFSDFVETIELCKMFIELSEDERKCVIAFTDPNESLDIPGMLENHFRPLSMESQRKIYDFIQKYNIGCNYANDLIYCLNEEYGF